MNRLWILILAALLFWRCSSDRIAGGSSQQGNGYVACEVIDRDGSPVQNATARLVSSDYLSELPHGTAKAALMETTTDDSGRFVFDSVSPGEYRIEVNDRISNAVLLECTMDETGGVDLGTATALPYAAVTGKVDSTSVSSPSDLFIQIYGLQRLARVEQDGSFAFNDLPQGEYTLRFVSLDSSIAPVKIDSVKARADSTTSLSPFALWKHSSRLRINTASSGAEVTQDVVDFPLAVRLASTPSSTPGSLEFDFSQASGNGEDLRFSKPDGTALPYEIEMWDSAGGTAAVWVRIDTVYGNNDSQYVRMYWGAKTGSATRSRSNGADVFGTEVGFTGVWHLDEEAQGRSGQPVYRDATSNANHGLDSVFASGKDGCLGRGQVFVQGTELDQLEQIVVTDPSDRSLDFPADFSVSCWFRSGLPGDDGYLKKLVSKEDDALGSFSLHLGADSTTMGYLRFKDWTGGNSKVPGAQDSTISCDDNQWHFAFGCRRSGVLELYVDGSLVAISPANANAIENRGDLRIGQNRFQRYSGSIDEARVEGVARDAAWIKLSYETQRPDQKTLSVE